MRHLAEIHEIAPNSDTPELPFPDGWFDFPERELADLGAMFFLLSMSRFHRPRSVAQTIATLEPPLRLRQYHIFRSGGFARAFVTWAGLDTETEMQFAVDHEPLRPDQWNIGPSKWVIDFVAPFGHLQQAMRQLVASEQTNRLRTLWHNRRGTRARVIEWERDAQGGDVRIASYGRMQFKHRLSEA